MACIANTLGKKKTEKIWKKKATKGLKEILIEDVVNTKVHFKPKPNGSDIAIQTKKFELVGEDDSSTDIDHEKKATVSEWFKDLVFCPMSN
jgi:hypothetical protein